MVRKNILKKQKIVEELVDLMGSGKTVAIASIERVPADLLQKIRRELRGEATIRVVKRRLLLRALEQLKGKIPGIEGLEGYANGPVAVIVTDMDPFRLFKKLKEFKRYAPVKAGQVAPVDIVVPAGISPVPAPMIAEIKAAGIPSKVTRGFVEVTEDYVAVKAGEVVPESVANALAKLGVKPLEIMLAVQAAWNDGIVFPRDVLDVSVEEILSQLATAHMHAINLAVHAGYPTAESLPIMLAKAHREALGLAVAAGYVTGETAKYVLARAYGQALALASKLPEDALDDELKAALQGVAAAAPAPAQQESSSSQSEEESSSEEKSEEDAAAGLASLFG